MESHIEIYISSQNSQTVEKNKRYKNCHIDEGQNF